MKSKLYILFLIPIGILGCGKYAGRSDEFSSSATLPYNEFQETLEGLKTYLEKASPRISNSEHIFDVPLEGGIIQSFLSTSNFPPGAPEGTIKYYLSYKAEDNKRPLKPRLVGWLVLNKKDANTADVMFRQVTLGMTPSPVVFYIDRVRVKVTTLATEADRPNPQSETNPSP